MGGLQKTRGLRFVLLWMCVVTVIACAFVIGRSHYERYRADKLDVSVRELYKGDAGKVIRQGFSFFPIAYAESEENAAVNAPEPADQIPAVHEDFRQLYEENEHTVGWLTLGERIDHPVVKSDNEFYLNHNFYGEKDSNGTLFVNMDNQLWPRDDVLLIHGHNMKSGAMFGRLTRYEQYDYLREHPVITFRTIYDTEDVYYVPISAFHASMIPENADYFDITRFNFENDLSNENPEYQAYLDELREWSLWESPFEADVDDELLMLVTCSYQIDDGRFMLVCRKLRASESVDMIRDVFEKN